MNPVVASAASHPRRWPWWAGSVALLVTAAGACEVAGWPFLAEAIQPWMASVLQRRVDLSIDGHTPASVRVRLLGRLRIEAPLVKIGDAGHTLNARDAVVELSYADLWRASRGHALEIRLLQAADFDGAIGRMAKAPASCDLGPGDGATTPSTDRLREVRCIDGSSHQARVDPDLTL
ncbi:hypothetical protein [Piscinibacter sp. XHJ-5]|uniref:hypothetical protein n=1 Tax=Piscinibacter sp. XHJ-5 TaxID=3037797 RepID=UPI00245328DE|nr:hypothetical protein [Piscinibacter sp. XHJ-5]